MAEDLVWGASITSAQFISEASLPGEVESPRPFDRGNTRSETFASIVDGSRGLGNIHSETSNFAKPASALAPPRRGKSMAEQIDTFQIELAVAFREHRSQVEQILDRNTEAMEEMDRAVQLNIAKLRAENATLREHAGLGGEEHQLHQAVMLDASANVMTTKEAKKHAKLKEATGNIMDDQAPKKRMAKADSTPSQQKAASNAAPSGGAWQSFVCWVPNGAALESPAPWQPLPEKTVVANGISKRTSQTKQHNQDGDIADDQDSDDGRKRFEVIKVFAATSHELALSRRTFTTRRTLTEDKLKVIHSGKGIGESTFGSETDLDDGILAFHDTDADWFTIHPQDPKREFWDVSTLVLVVYDMITIPLSLFDTGDSFFLLFMSWTTRVFWTLDMAMSACTGVVMPDGTVRGDVRFIVRRYLKTWFVIDLVIVASDWLEIAIQASAGAGFLGRISRGFRIIRIIRLLRLVRLKAVVEQVTERIQSERIPFGISVVRYVVLLLSIAHLFACMWWGLGDRAAGHTWVDKYGDRPATVESQYLLCLHFALTQFTGGMDEVAPASALERLYVIVLLMLAFVTATLILSVLTSSLTQMHIIGGVRERQVATLRKFLRQNFVSSALAMRITRSAQHALSADLTADVVELLPVVSDALRVEMHFEMYTAVLCNHAFFADYVQFAPQVMRRVCHYAISTVQLSHGDVVFSRGEAPSEPKMYFIVKGTADYEFQRETHSLQERSWISEPVLWTRWTHVGSLTATSEVKLAALDAKAFQDISDRFKDTQAFDPKVYAADFVAQLNAVDQVSDLISVRYEFASMTRVASNKIVSNMYEKTNSSHAIMPIPSK